MDNRKITLLVLLDLSAAFDTVDHELLIHQMQSQIGIDGIALKWFRSYLHDRHQLVCINNARSAEVRLDYGVPQGSVIGPSAFSIYTLPLGDIIHSHDLDYHCYADDTQIYISVDPDQCNIDAAINRLETCIDDVKSWMSHNYLKLNDDKTEFMVIGSKYQTAKVHVSHIRVGNSKVIPSSEVRNLGVIFDSSLSMENHITTVCRAAYASIRNIGRIRKHVNRETAEMMVHAFITSKIDIGNSLLHGITKTQLHRLQRIQNIAARLITYTKPHQHITPVLHDLHWLPVEQRITFKVALFVYKILYVSAPAYLTELVELYSPARNLRSAAKGLLQETVARNQWGSRSFHVAAAKIWNNLPISVCSAKSVCSFKTHLKTHLFQITFN